MATHDPQMQPQQAHPTASLSSSPHPAVKAEAAPIWWSNAIFFIGMHFAAAAGVWYSPWWALDYRTMGLCIGSWQLATFGITIGYHRLWSHRSLTASFPLKCVLAGMGCLGFQGSIKWWVLRHRLHHAFTDTDSDPYDANKGLYHSHMGWIFRKPSYPRMQSVERKDLDADPVVRFQHKYYLPLTLGLGLVAPTLIGATYGDAMGGYIWGGLVARLLIWHFTFMINSLAHYLGDQAYSTEVTARGNFLLAIFTGGEANHNFHHAYPRDYRNGPRILDWDPTKWTIYLLHHFTPFVPVIHSVSESEILKARAHVLSVQSDKLSTDEDDKASSFAFWSSYASATSDDGADSVAGYGSSASDSDDAVSSFLSGSGTRRRRVERTTREGLPIWTQDELVSNLDAMNNAPASTAAPRKRPLVLVIDGYAVDATYYAKSHPGGMALLHRFAVSSKSSKEPGMTASEAFGGGLNNHGWSANEMMKSLRVAKLEG